MEDLLAYLALWELGSKKQRLMMEYYQAKVLSELHPMMGLLLDHLLVDQRGQHQD